VRAASKRLARELFLQMMIYQQRLESKQNVLQRFVDIGTDLFVISTVCSYAASLEKGKSAQYDGSAIELADLFSRQARTRIMRNFKDAWRNHDKLLNHVAKQVLAGKFEWLENEIIK
jgi:hypothetical protein